MVRRVLILVLFLAQFLATANAQQNQATPSANDIAQGQTLFVAHCGSCHGPTGSGGRGANLAIPELEQADTDAALHRIIRQGIPGTEMPGSFQLTDEEIVKVGAFVRSLGKIAPEKIAGDPMQGQALFKARCASCHFADGEGGVTGPAMTGIASRRGVSWMRAKLLDPLLGIPDDFRLVELTTRTGQKVTGIRINEDTTSIQLRDMTGRLRSFWKTDLTNLTKQAGRSPMPSYKSVLSDTQLDDVVAYLASLKEVRKK